MAIDLARFIGRFVDEARDHIRQLSSGVALLEEGRSDAEVVNAVFRSAHTIKGSSRMLKLMPISETAHRLEDVLGALRDGAIEVTPLLAQRLYQAIDAIAAMVESLAESLDPARVAAPDEALLQRLADCLQADAGESAPQAALAAVPEGAAEAVREQPTGELPAGSSAIGVQARMPESVRVRIDKLDELIRLMGEVATGHAQLRARAAEVFEIEAALARLPAQSAEVESATRALHRFGRHLRDGLLAQDTLIAALRDSALVMRMLPLSVVFEPLGRTAREFARSMGKELLVTVSGDEIELDRQVIDRLADPIVHLLRNAVDHGLELPEVRERQGKPRQGRVSLHARQDGGRVVIEVSDDGAGVDLAAVRDKAVRKGLCDATQAAAMSEHELLDLIFRPGFSTAAIITDVSGRGVGLDTVRQAVVDALRGELGTETRSGHGSTFRMRLPLSLAVVRTLLVEAGGEVFGFTAQHVSDLVRVSQQALLTVAERSAVIVRNEFVPVVSLAELLRLGASAPPGVTRGVLLLVLRVRNDKVAVVVDALVDEGDMVIKPLPASIRSNPLVAGVVVTAQNKVASVLHAPALLSAARSARSVGAAGGSTPAAATRAAYRVLVVDDSLNTREIEKDVLEAHGYQVTLAEDGVDGLAKALAEDFDAVLTDVEMPHMDGFTLTARLREDERYRHRPILIITSREKEDDKRRGMQVGADAYIVKGDFDQHNLVDTLRALLG